MTDWTARIDALLAEKPNTRSFRPNGYLNQLNSWNERRLALAAERLREPHGHNCRALWSLTAPDCTCGKDSDLARILEGK